jgi:hypothetical protein
MKARKQALKPRSKWLAEVQYEFNRYVRFRDFDQPCISCQKYHDGQNHAGHYLTTASNPELRFNEIGCHLQCSICNNHLSGNQLQYRKHLITKIGLPLVEWLEGPHKPLKATIQELQFLRTYYRNRAKEAENYAMVTISEQ